MARTLEDILEDEKPEVVAAAMAKAEAMLLTMGLENSQAPRDIDSESGCQSRALLNNGARGDRSGSE